MNPWASLKRGAAWNFHRSERDYPVYLNEDVLPTGGSRQIKRVAFPSALFDLSSREELNRHDYYSFSKREGSEKYFLPTSVLRKSPHLWLGYSRRNKLPILLSREILNEHAHIMGGTGTCKTAKGLIPLVEQLIRFRDAAVVIIDLKGDRALFQSARLAAERAGLAFRWFTTQVGLSTYAFNPCHQGDDELFSLTQIADNLVEALGLEHGDGYGHSFFSKVNRHVFGSIVKGHYRKFGKHPRSFRHLLRYYQDDLVLDRKERQDSYEAFTSLELMAEVDQLNLAAEPNDPLTRSAIRMADVLSERQVVYFNLPQAIESCSAREISRLAINSLFRSCYQKNMGKAPAEIRHVYLVIDEFQNVVGKNFSNTLEQGRTLGLHVILSHQHLGQLYKGPEQDFRDVIKGTRFKHLFSAELGSETHEYLLRAGGETTVALPSASTAFQSDELGQSRVSGAFSVRDQVTPRLTSNELIEISDNLELSIVHVKSGHGYSQFGGFPFVLESDFHITKTEYDARFSAPWPVLNSETMLSPSVPSTISAPSAKVQRKNRRDGKRKENRRKSPEREIPEKAKAVQLALRNIESKINPPAQGDAGTSNPNEQTTTTTES